MKPTVLRVLIVEDTPDRQQVLRSLARDHAWVLVHTADRAICLLDAYDFDLILLDFDLAGTKRGDSVAESLARSRNAGSKVIVHSMNAPGAHQIAAFLPDAERVPISRMTASNNVFRRIRQELAKGVDIDWATVFGKD